jgi:hypothetical protein
MGLNITTIINYCTNDYRFLKLCVDAIRPVSKEIIIPVCDHFFNGEKENRFLLNRSYEENSDCKFIEYTFPKKETYGKNPPFKITIDDVNFKHYMHSTSRYLGYLASDPTTDLILFLDVDEIVDTKRFIEWLKTFDFSKNNGLRFASYFYFREARYRSLSSFNSALAVKRSALLDPEWILDIRERHGLNDRIEGLDAFIVSGLDGKPLFHHYSYVRTYDETIKKVTTWGHAGEKDWIKRVNEEFSNDFMMMDMLFYHMYEEVIPFHDPFSIKVPFGESDFEKKEFYSNVTYLDQENLELNP